MHNQFYGKEASCVTIEVESDMDYFENWSRLSLQKERQWIGVAIIMLQETEGRATRSITVS